MKPNKVRETWVDFIFRYQKKCEEPKHLMEREYQKDRKDMDGFLANNSTTKLSTSDLLISIAKHLDELEGQVESDRVNVEGDDSKYTLSFDSAMDDLVDEVEDVFVSPEHHLKAMHEEFLQHSWGSEATATETSVKDDTERSNSGVGEAQRTGSEVDETGDPPDTNIKGSSSRRAAAIMRAERCGGSRGHSGCDTAMIEGERPSVSSLVSSARPVRSDLPHRVVIKPLVETEAQKKSESCRIRQMP